MKIERVKAVFEQIFSDSSLQIEDAGTSPIIILPQNKITLRPGNTISGPTMMTLADAAIYIAILYEKEMSGVHYVTSNLNIHFLHRPHLGDLKAVPNLLKIGARQIVGEVGVFDMDERKVATASATYIAVGSAK